MIIESSTQLFEQGRRAPRIKALEDHEDLGICRRFISLNMVVVNLGITAAKIGEDGLDAWDGKQFFLDKLQGAVRLGETGSRRGIDLDEKLRRIRFRKQARAEYRNQQHRQQQRATNRSHHGRFGSGKTEVQGRTIVAMNAVHDAL